MAIENVKINFSFSPETKWSGRAQHDVPNGSAIAVCYCKSISDAHRSLMHSIATTHQRDPIWRELAAELSFSLDRH